jgi:hypothetical protein
MKLFIQPEITEQKKSTAPIVKSAVILEVAYVTAPPDPDADVLVELRLTFRTPPMAPPGGEVRGVEFWTRVIKASSVVPVEDALIAPTIPVNTV